MAEQGDHVEIVLYAVRHGETGINVHNGLQGITDEPLNEKGRDQAGRAGARLSNVPFQAVWSSDLPRAVETATLIVERNGAFDDPGRIRKDGLLRERSWGASEGKPFEELLKEESFWRCAGEHGELLGRLGAQEEPFKKLMKSGGFESKTALDMLEIVSETFVEWCGDGGESSDDVRARVDKFMQEFYRQVAGFKSGSPVLLVSHLAFLYYFAEHFHGSGKFPDFPKFKHLSYLAPNTGVTQMSLVVDRKTAQLVSGKVELLHCGKHLLQQ